MLSLRIVLWNKLAYWQKGAVVGAAGFALLGCFALGLCLAQFLGITQEGYISAGWMLLFFGLPTTLIEAFLESYDPSFRQQLANLFLLAFLNSVLVGTLIGVYVGRRIAGRSEDRR